MEISIVSPVYNAEKLVHPLVNQIIESVSKITLDFEIILVNDGSRDNSWSEIMKNCKKNTHIVGIDLSRNFGQHNAIAAGLNSSKGKWVVVMDCDLQDEPTEIINLYNKAQEGFEIVFARRKNRNDNFIKKLSSKFFYKVFSYMTDTKQDSSVSNFGIFNRKVIEAINGMGDYVRVFPILIQWVGFSKSYIDVKHNKRLSGKSSYNKLKLYKLAFNMIVSFSEKPLKLGLKIGLLISISAIVLAIYYLIMYLQGKILVPGFTSLAILISFSTGVILTFVGLLGLYIGKISEQTKNRPNYIISKKIVSDESK